ncbi:MAG: phosphatase PAP2-related protein [bacterium]|nr:phosphatase PAP2-related protein [bacterium]
MIKEAFCRFWHHWKVLLKDPAYFASLLIGMSLLIAAYIVNFWASTYNDTQIYISVGDLIIDNIPVVNLHFLFTWGMYLLMVGIFAYPILFKPEIAPFCMKTFALLIFLRCGFILLTNIGPPAGFYYDGNYVGGNILSDFLFRNDLFFSGHTAYPFLAFLLFKETKILKWFFLGGSIIMAVTVLFMHVHYSIDVFAAFFITYGIYSLSDKIFNKLNVRFSTRIRLHGWAAFNKLKDFANKHKPSI